MRVILAAALAVSIIAAPAAAEPFRAGANPSAVPVSYTDLDLDRADHAQTMLSRLSAASARACELRELSQRGVAARRAEEACRDETLAHVVALMNAPELTRAFEEARR